MIPTFDIGSWPAFDPAKNGTVPYDWSEVGIFPDPDNQEYGESDFVDGPDLDRTIQWERAELLAIDRRSATPQEFEQLASDLRTKYEDDDCNWSGTPMPLVLDFGIVSCVAALNYLGIPTTASCRGHFGSREGREVPSVRFVGDDVNQETWDLLASLASRTGCHLVGCGDGLVELIGHSCLEMLEFAQCVRMRVSSELRR